MIRDSLDVYDVKPLEMVNYLRHYGLHFNHKACDFAVSKMKKGKEKLLPLSKEQVDTIINKYGYLPEHNSLYDYVYVANMAKADFYGSSIEDDKHLAMFIKDMVDDVDQRDGFIFNRWYADTVRNGIPIDWEELL